MLRSKMTIVLAAALAVALGTPVACARNVVTVKDVKVAGTWLGDPCEQVDVTGDVNMVASVDTHIDSTITLYTSFDYFVGTGLTTGSLYKAVGTCVMHFPGVTTPQTLITTISGIGFPPGPNKAECTHSLPVRLTLTFAADGRLSEALAVIDPGP